MGVGVGWVVQSVRLAHIEGAALLQELTEKRVGLHLLPPGKGEPPGGAGTGPSQTPSSPRSGHQDHSAVRVCRS